MDIYNKWKMRASGERKHQASTQTEAATLSAFDALLKEKSISDAFFGMPEAERVSLMEQVHAAIQRAEV